MRRTKPETQRQARIVAALEAAGRLVIRVHCGAVRVRGGYMHLAPTGTPDLYVIGWGWLETKTPEGELSKEQIAMHARIKEAGERVAVAVDPVETVRLVCGQPVVCALCWKPGHASKLCPRTKVGKARKARRS